MTLEIASLMTLALVSAFMMGRWLPAQSAPGWYSAGFCSGLLMLLGSASILFGQLLPNDNTLLEGIGWLKQLAWYAAPPLLASMALALSLNYQWGKEIWGRILLALCGVYWICLHYQVTHYIVPASCALLLMSFILDFVKGRHRSASLLLSLMLAVAAPSVYFYWPHQITAVLALLFTSIFLKLLK